MVNPLEKLNSRLSDWRSIIGSLLLGLILCFGSLDALIDPAHYWVAPELLVLLGGIIGSATGVSMRVGMKKSQTAAEAAKSAADNIGRLVVMLKADADERKEAAKPDPDETPAS